MIVALSAFAVVQVPAYDVIDVVSVRHWFVTTSGTVLVAFLVAATVVLRRSRCRICSTDCDSMFIDVISVHMVHVTVVKIIRMAFMLDRSMPASGTMLMRMAVVNITGFCHYTIPFREGVTFTDVSLRGRDVCRRGLSVVEVSVLLL
jgi:hypothetical protein